jgi:Domain of unknown function (DUF4337)
MALLDSMLNLINKQPKDPEAPKPPVGSRSEREAKIKDKAGMVINIFALLLALNSWYAGGLSSTVMNNTIKANDIWNFYQAKSIKQTEYTLAAEQTNDKAKAEKWLKKAAEYDQGPEGKTALYDAAKKLEAGRDDAKKRSPWIGYASTAYQLSIVLLSASILAVSMPLFWGSFVVAGVGVLLSSQGVLLWF